MEAFDISSITKNIESWMHLMGNGFAGKLHGADLVTFELSLVVMILCLLIVICGLLGIIKTNQQIARQKALRDSVMGSQMIPVSTFLSNWKTTRSGNKVTGGYKTLDQPGCYVIITAPSPDWRSYENVYVGQSLHVCSRVRNHLTGHGNGDVYADVRNRKPVYVKIMLCDQRQMNAVEKNLIRAFNATSSYNRTAGGSKRR